MGEDTCKQYILQGLVLKTCTYLKQLGSQNPNNHDKMGRGSE